jgi:PhzF family phenazine biosynthesis protein
VTTDHTPFGGDVAGPAVARYTAFSPTPEGGNPAGVVLDATGMTDQQMLDIAAAVGYSETAFLVPRVDHIEARYFSPLAEVSFCGHATIAAAVAHAEVHGAGRLSLATQAGRVDVRHLPHRGRILGRHPDQRRTPLEVPGARRPGSPADGVRLVPR